MATANPSWGDTRIQDALKNVGHRVARSTIAAILKAEGIPPGGERPTSWQTLSCVPIGPALLAAEFFTTKVWMVRGLVTYETAFVIDLASRRQHIVGSIPHPDESGNRFKVLESTAAPSPFPSADAARRPCPRHSGSKTRALPCAVPALDERPASARPDLLQDRVCDRHRMPC
jgi:hypothetical protein